MNNDRSTTMELVNKNLAKRYRAEKRFQCYGLLSIIFGIICLLFLFTDIITKGIGAFTQYYIQLEVDLDADKLGISDSRDIDQLRGANYSAVIKQALSDRFETRSRRERKQLSGLISLGAENQLRELIIENPEKMLDKTHTLWFIADDDIDTYMKSRNSDDVFNSRLSEQQINWLEQLDKDEAIERRFNRVLFTAGDSREPELAGIRGAILGSFYALLVTFCLSFPIGIAAAIYLEEYAPKNKWTDLIEVNINNLAAVPSIIFGLLGLAIFIDFFGFPRSIPLVGGMVLTLMTLPTVIISSRAAIKAVPPSVREAAYGIGASKMQVVVHHVVPLAMPGMLTGTIIGMAQALGETAPLLMIGMVAFIVDIPGGITDPATVLPVQIYLWADSPERAFVEKTSAAIMVLLLFLITMNAVAIWARKRIERRW